ncbi:endolytic transglycosylase MltG [Marinomonas agarivorans]|nr:endolytic transglycosylase MltG [Marinomonas agarivorans]
MKAWLWRIAALVLILIISSSLALYYLLAKPLPIKDSQIYEIKAGVGSLSIANQFVQKGLIKNKKLLHVAVKLQPNWVPKVGKYQIDPDMSLLDVMALFHSGKAIVHKVTLVEGRTTKQYLLAMQEKGNIKMTLLNKSNEMIAETLGLEVQHAEGQFFADTYLYHDGDTDADILKQANKRLTDVLDEHWSKKQKNLPLKSKQQALILASIVEKETGVDYERPLIAGVFVNRLNKRMRLQTDPTVIYGLGEKFDGNIRRRHLRQKTPYNTYTIYGLPPTPIANVGEGAIKAALTPQKTKALYFVAQGDGTHKFSNTLRQHNAAVAKYQRFQRRADYQSTPKN